MTNPSRFCSRLRSFPPSAATLSLLATLTLWVTPVRAGFPEWENAVNQAGTPPVTTHFQPVRGDNPLIVDVGGFSGDRSFEFIVNASREGTAFWAGTNSALLSTMTSQGLKFEQHSNSGVYGITEFAPLVNLFAPVTAILDRDTHVVFTGAGNGTLLYVNGELAYTFAGVPLRVQGRAALGASLQTDGISLTDFLDGVIHGFASYDSALSPEEVRSHYDATGLGAFAEWRNAVTTQGTLPVRTRFQAVHGDVPVALDVGALTGDRSFEFIVNATLDGTTSALLGNWRSDILKYEQHSNAGVFGFTRFAPSIVNHNSPIGALPYHDLHVVITGVGNDTLLYVNGMLMHTFTGVPLRIEGQSGLGAALDSNGAFFDQLRGAIYGFASYDEALTAQEIQTHFAATGINDFGAWRNAVTGAGAAPAATRFLPVTGAAPLTFDVGALSGDRSFEFIVYAGINTSNSAVLLGDWFSQVLKFEQYNNTGMMGLTELVPAIIDILSPVPSIQFRDAHFVFTSDGTDTRLYVNGSLAHTFTGAPLRLTGPTGLGAALRTNGAFDNHLNGMILGFASYDTALSAAEIQIHSAGTPLNFCTP